ncbi:MAG: hypothetical protein P4M05_28350 [Bradyrhizobium sp.]|nr:hypothetical protein [Bradyrhizobium sp.]
MAKDDLETVALAMMTVTARLPGDPEDSHHYPVLGDGTDFHGLPADDSEATVDDTITQETVLKLATAAIRAIRLPTPGVFNAGALNFTTPSGEPAQIDRPTANRIFTAMIDELLRK